MRVRAGSPMAAATPGGVLIGASGDIHSFILNEV